MTKIERLDNFRRKGLTLFFWAFTSVIGAFLVVGPIAKIVMPKFSRSDIMSSAEGLRAIESWNKFLKVFTPIMAVTALFGLLIILVSFACWSRYKRKLSKDPATGVAVRDERIRFFWQLAFRRAIVAVIVFHFASWMANNIGYLAFGYTLFNSSYLSLVTAYLIVITSIGTFLRLDRLDRRSDENLTEDKAPKIFRLSMIERGLIRRAVPLCWIYGCWHFLFIAIRIILYISGFFTVSADDEITGLRPYEIFCVAQLIWLAILGLIFLIFLRKKNRVIAEDEGLHINWLKACRLSAKFSLIFALAVTMAEYIFTLMSFLMEHSKYNSLLSYVLRVEVYFRGYYLILFIAVTVLLGSYTYFDRWNQGDDHAAEK